MDLFSEDYLAHYGILGQKWGVRRYQNADGSLTSAGQKRYSGAISGTKTLKDYHLSKGEKLAEKGSSVKREVLVGIGKSVAANALTGMLSSVLAAKALAAVGNNDDPAYVMGLNVVNKYISGANAVYQWANLGHTVYNATAVNKATKK